MNQQIRDKIEYFFNLAVLSSKPVSGGTFTNAYQIMLENNEFYFIKYKLEARKGLFEAEAHGLNELAKAEAVRVPKVFHFEDDFIVLELVPTGMPVKNFYNHFGKAIGNLHKHKGITFGLSADNFINGNLQSNIPEEKEKFNWVEFYYNKRLLVQYRLAESNNYVSSELKKCFSQLEGKIETILAGDTEKPSLLHGDLWSQNFMITNEGKPCLIDPAVYYGSREVDLAMTKLFGGFGAEFYYAYNLEYPLQEGYQYRENIYKLYHVLNNLNLYGPSYLHYAVNLINYYIK